MTSPSLLSQVQPARASGARDLPALETVMQSLALDARSPVALELAATKTTRQFLLRAEHAATLRHLERQIQARYPQAIIRPAGADPLQCAPGEECSVVELRPGAASYLPLRTWKARDLLAEGTDPLLGILAAFGNLPTGARAVAQLALVPASPTWSASLRRRAVEHPLEKERLQQRLNTSTSPPSMGRVVLLLLLVMGLAVALRFRQQLSRVIPLWLLEAGASLLHGKAAHLTAWQIAQVVAGAIVLLSLLSGVALLMSHLVQTPIYDQRLVAEKTARPAYRVRLRLFVITAGRDVSFSESPITLRTRLVSLRAALKSWPLSSLMTKRVRACLKGRWQRLHADWQMYRQRARARRMHRLGREELLRMLVAAYAQYHLAAGGYFMPRRLSPRHVRRLLRPLAKRLFRREGWTIGVLRSAHFLSVADVAALWHLPQAHDLADLPYVEPAMARTLLAPALLTQGNGYPLGISTHAGQTLPVFLPFSCLRQNMLAAASTGKGKSNLFEHLLRAFALARMTGLPEGRGGALLVDPHGDLAERVSGSLPTALVDDIILISLAERDYPIGFNPLDLSQGQDRDKTIDNLISVIEALWPSSYGPRTESFVEYGTKSLAEANMTLIERDPLHGPDEQFTLLDVVPLFRNETFRHAVLELVRDQHLLNWWNHYYEQLDGRQQAEFTSSIITKLSKFASSRMSRHILGQPRSSLNFAEVIRQNKILLLSCAAGEVGSDLAALFGSLFVGFFQTALQEQAHLPQVERHRFLVLIDEFQSLVGVNYQTMLAELRKYGGSFALATQSLAYLERFERTLRATVLANVDHVFAFTMADEDARLLHLPGIDAEDMTQLPDYTCYARLSLDGQRLPVFSLRLAAPEEASGELRQDILSRSRSRYGRPVGAVDQALLESEARQRTIRPRQKRKGNRGYEVIWEGTGEERIDEVLGMERRHTRGTRKSAETREGTVLPRHTMYIPDAQEESVRLEEKQSDPLLTNPAEQVERAEEKQDAEEQ